MKSYFNNLQEFILELEQQGELVRISKPVSRDLEISEIYFRQIRSKDGGKALLFENVIESPFPVLINAFGSHRRMKIAFGNRTADELASELESLLKLLQLKPPKDAREAFLMLSKVKHLFKFPPRRQKIKNPACQEVVWRGDRIDLNQLPILKSWPDDGGRFITFGLTLTRSILSGNHNLGMYRLQVLDKNRCAMHWQVHKDGQHFWQEYRKQNRRMSVSVIIGADPSIIFSATAPMPPNVYELLLAGFIRSKGVKVVQGVTNDLLVPAESEFVIEGYVDPSEFVDEGPFGDHTGYYTPVEKFPVLHVTAITMRKNPVYAATVVGRSPQEDCYLAKATERIFLPLLRFLAPEVKDQMLPWDGCFHNGVVLAVDKQFPYQARRLMNHLWGFSQMSFAKSIVTVDGDVPLHSGETLLKHILNIIDLKRDLFISEGILDQLDHSGVMPLWGGKLGIDATSCMDDESKRETIKLTNLPLSWLSGKKFDEFFKKSSDVFRTLLKKIGADLVDLFYYGGELKNPVWILSVKKRKHTGGLSEKLASRLKESCKARIILLLDEEDRVRDGSYVLWKLYGNVDPLRDLHRVEVKGCGTVLILDATSKNSNDGYLREWPRVNRMDPSTVQRVTDRWFELFGEEPFDVERP